MANIKVSELPSATSLNDEDLVMIVQNNESKKISGEVINSKIDGEEWHDMVLINNWETYAQDYQKAQYKKRGNQIFLRGLIRNGNDNTVFTQLPEGYRPLLNNYLTVCDDNGGNSIKINSSGELTAFTYSSWLSLTGTSFFID